MACPVPRGADFGRRAGTALKIMEVELIWTQESQKEIVGWACSTK